jgi:rhamnose utilization protein RhaD (predicted bifunctional aldolase and dehydrogenase)
MTIHGLFVWSDTKLKQCYPIKINTFARKTQYYKNTKGAKNFVKQFIFASLA